MGSRDIISTATSPIFEPVPIFAYQPDRSWISAHADGIKPVTYARTSSQTYVDRDGVLRIAPANVPAVGRYGVELEGAATSYYWQGYTESGGIITSIEAPVTRTVTLPATGAYVLWIEGNAALSVTVAANTAVGSGWGTLTKSGSLPLTITTAGTVDVTVANGAVGDIVQLTTGIVKSSYIPTPTSTPVTRTTSASDTSGKGLQADLTQRMIDSLTGEVSDWTAAWTTVSGAPTYSGGNKILTYSALTATDYHALLPAGVSVGHTIEVGYTISGYSAGSFNFGFGSGQAGVSRTANGTYVERGTLTTNTNLYAYGTNLTGVVTISYIRRVRADGTTNPGEGTLIQWVYLPWDSEGLVFSALSILATDNSAFKGFLAQYSGGLWRLPYLNDGFGGVSGPTGHTSSGVYALVYQWSAIDLVYRCGRLSGALLLWGGNAAYRGFFPIHSSNKLRWFYGGTLPLGIGSCALYDTILTDDEIIRAAQALQ